MLCVLVLVAGAGSKVLYYMSGFKTTAPMVRMVLAVMRDIRPFLVLIMVLWFGNGLAFRMLFECVCRECERRKTKTNTR